MMTKRLFLLLVLVAFVPSGALVADEVPEGDGYEMVLSSISEIGQHDQTRFRVGNGSLAACNMAKRSQVIPRVTPRGLVLSPGGNSYEWTVFAVACEPEARK